jgi:beta-glucosidase/6-phospho-beta-glucosidase/beta-galactosidase
MKEAITDGTDMISYLHWSFMDNYEWQEAFRPEAKFGLFRIDPKTSDEQIDFNRQITRGAEVFKFIVEKSTTQSKGKNGIVLDSALSEAKDRFGTITPDGSKVM